MKMNEPLPGATPTSLRALEDRSAFLARHIGTTDDDQAAMLATLGFATRGALIDAIVPPAIREQAPMKLAAPVPEAEALAQAARDRRAEQGAEVVHRAGLLRHAHAGRDPAQHPREPRLVHRVHALPAGDLAGAARGAGQLPDDGVRPDRHGDRQRLDARRGDGRRGSDDAGAARGQERRASVSSSRTTCSRRRWTSCARAPVRSVSTSSSARPPPPPRAARFAVLLQYPGATGEVRDDRALAEAVHAQGGLVIVAADILALTLLAPPGEWGADVVVGSTQRFGVPMGYGGPHAGYFATRDEFKRSMPGRLVGVTVDANGNAAYRLALQTREQHIRREKATSNICTAQVLLAVIAGMYAVYHGPDGLTTIARRVHRMTAILKEGLERLGFTVPTQAFFDTITVTTGPKTADILAGGVAYGFNFRKVDERTLGISFDETTTRDDIARIWDIFAFDDTPFTVADHDAAVTDALPPALRARDTVPDPPGLPPPSLGNRDAALPAPARRPRPGARPLDDPAGLVHDEAQRDVRDDPGDLARIRRAASVRAGRPGGRLSPDDPRTREDDVRGHRLRRRVAAAQRRVAGRICRSADDRGLSREPRRAASQRVPDSGVRARHQSGVGADGRHAGRRRRVRRRRQRGHGRPRGEGRRACAAISRRS